MGYGKEEYSYSITDSGNDAVSVGDGEYGMEITTPAGMTFSRDGYDTFEGAVSGARQSIENMASQTHVNPLDGFNLIDMLTPIAYLSTLFPGILNDDGRSA